jgi:hypothetical protein
MKRVRITYVGEEEYGTVDAWDERGPGIGRAVELFPGQFALVSEELASRLEADHPTMFEFGEAEEISDADFAEMMGEQQPVPAPDPELEPDGDEPQHAAVRPRSRRRKAETSAA